MKSLLRLLLILLLTFTLTACMKPHKIAIQQGNVLCDEDMAAIHVGMSRDEIIKRLGYPVLKNIFTSNDLVYVYTYKPGYSHMTKRRLILYFNGDRVSHFVVDNQPICLPEFD